MFVTVLVNLRVARAPPPAPAINSKVLSYRRSVCSVSAPGVRSRRRVRGVVPAWRRIPRRSHHPTDSAGRTRFNTTPPEAAASRLPLSHEPSSRPPRPVGGAHSRAILGGCDSRLALPAASGARASRLSCDASKPATSANTLHTLGRHVGTWQSSLRPELCENIWIKTSI